MRKIMGNWQMQNFHLEVTVKTKVAWLLWWWVITADMFCRTLVSCLHQLMIRHK